MTDGDEERPARTRRDPRIAPRCASEGDRNRGVVATGRFPRSPGEGMLRHSDRRDVEAHAHVARDTELRGMQPTMPVHHQDVRLRGKATDRCLDPGKLARRQIRGNVRERSITRSGRDLDHGERRRVDADRRRVHPIRVVRNVDTRDAAGRSALVLLPHKVRQMLLVPPELIEQRHGRSHRHESIRGHAARSKRDTFPRQPWARVRDHGSAVGSGDSVGGGDRWMLGQPGGDRSSGADVTEGACDRAAGRDTAARNLSEASVQGVRELVHAGVSMRVRKTFLRIVPSTPLPCRSCSAAVSSSPRTPGGAS